MQWLCTRENLHLEPRYQTSQNIFNIKNIYYVKFFVCNSRFRSRLWQAHHFFLLGETALQWDRASSFTRFLDHTRRTTVGRIPLDEWSARRRDLYLTTHNTQTSTSPVGMDVCLSARERLQTHALDRAATGTDWRTTYKPQMHKDLVLRPSCVPQKVGVNKKNYIPIRNKGFV